MKPELEGLQEKLKAYLPDAVTSGTFKLPALLLLYYFVMMKH